MALNISYKKGFIIFYPNMKSINKNISKGASNSIITISLINI